MNKLLILFIIAYLILTTVIVAVKPQLHKPVSLSQAHTVIENLPEKYLQEEEEPKIVHVQQYEEAENIKIKPQQNEFEQQIIKTQEVQPQFIEKNIKPVQQPNQIQSQSVKIKDRPAETQTVQKPKYELPKSVMDIVNNNNKPNQEEEKIVQIPQAPIQKQTTEKPKPQQVQVQQAPVQIKDNAPLTEAEEVIVWNKWRSDLQNKVMRDSRITAPRGTVFRFSFTVNKFGQISNLKVWSDTPSYTNYAIQALKPLLLSYQGQPILNFPDRTQRITTNVLGGFVVSNQDRYTTPKDYSDIERVKQ